MSDPGARFDAYLDGLRRLTPSPTNRASELGFPCDRYNWYARTSHEEAALPSRYLQSVLTFGSDYEHMLQERLGQAGYMFRRQQSAKVWPAYNISGTPEGDISWDLGATWMLYEIKGLHPSMWSKVSTWRDFLTMGPIYARYPAQGQIYMLLENVDRMVWLVGKKGTYEVKWLEMELDPDLAESYVRKAERINRMVENGPVPDRTDDRRACEVCAFRLSCLPGEDHGEGAKWLDDPELLGKLQRRDELAVSVREYRELDDEIKAQVKGVPFAIAGEWQIMGKEVSRKGYEVKPTTYWDTRIQRIKEVA